jgi:sulfite oxidase
MLMVNLTRRMWLKLLGSTGARFLLGRSVPVGAQVSRQATQPLPDFTGPGDFLTAFTPNEAFYVRYHLDRIPNEIDLTQWRLEIQGNVDRPRQFRFEELVKGFAPVSVAAVNECSGNSRSRFQPRVAGGQWGNGAMGSAKWTGVRLRELLAAAGVKPGTAQIQFEGLDRGAGPEGKGSHAFLKYSTVHRPGGELVIGHRVQSRPVDVVAGLKRLHTTSKPHMKEKRVPNSACYDQTWNGAPAIDVLIPH